MNGGLGVTRSLPALGGIILSWSGISGFGNLLLFAPSCDLVNLIVFSCDEKSQDQICRSEGDSVPENCIRNAHSTVPASTGSGKVSRGKVSESMSSSSPASVTGLCWLDTNTLASIGDSDGKVKLWDLRKSYSLYRGDPVPKAELAHPATSSTRGFTSISCSPACPSYIYVSCMDSYIYKYDVVNLFQQPSAVFTGAEIKNFFINHSISTCGRWVYNFILWQYHDKCFPQLPGEWQQGPVGVLVAYGQPWCSSGQARTSRGRGDCCFLESATWHFSTCLSERRCETSALEGPACLA